MIWSVTQNRLSVINHEFEAKLISESARAKRYKSQHVYDMSEMGLSREEMRKMFKDVIEEYEFPG